jgi:hypothetical protein
MPDWDEPEDGDGPEGETETVPCPSCRQPVYEEAQRCPHCGNYISEEDAPGRLPGWMILGVLVCLGVVVGWIVPGC